jgi:penicillin-binding protein 2
LIQQLRPGAARRVRIDPAWRQAIMDGLKGAAGGPRGTSTQVFKDWNQGRFPIFGKTGTAQRLGRPNDQSWYVAYSYDQTPKRKPIVVAVTIEDAGFGAEAAAPAARLMLAKWFNQQSKAKLVRGDSRTR